MENKYGNYNSISFYKNVKITESKDTITMVDFISAISNGKWQDKVLKIRTIIDKELRRAAKSELPNVTLSGLFGKRNDNDCIVHSGFIGIDIDDLNEEVESTKELLKQDPYVYAVFTSVSGNGLCVIFKINPEKHRESFEGIADYLIKKYQITIDPTGINQSRTRYVSFDPNLWFNEQSLKFKKYLLKQKKRVITATIFVQSEFDELIKKMVDANVSCVEDYRDWRDIGFGLAEKFGEGGRQYFHSLSSCSSKYDPSICDEQYKHSLNRREWGGKKVTIATIYWFAKQAGINVNSQLTKKVAAATSTGKKAGLSASQIIKNLSEFENITGIEDTVKQAFENNQSFTFGESLVENVRMWLRHNYKLKRNLITRKIENDGVPQTETDFNTMFLDALIIFEKLSFDIFMKVILSHNTFSFNPLKDFISSLKWDGENRIDNLGACINSNTGSIEWRCLMVRKWFIGIVSAPFGFINELQLILVGGKNTGKTWFFTEILPEELKPYFGRSQLIRGTDDQILMCEKLLILNDEYGGKNRNDERVEKGLMSSPFFSLRVPYGRGNEDVVRLSTLCGTCNDLGVLDDATGNRRIIVIESIGKFDFNLYNSLDKYQLLAEAYQLYKNGERPVFTDEEINSLEKITDGQYSKVVIEGELIQQYFLPHDKTNPWDFMTATQVKVYLENHTRGQLNINKIGAQLKKLGYLRRKENGVYGYDIAKIPVNN